MAGKSTISITFKLDGDTKGFKDLAKDAEGLKQVITSTLSEAEKLSPRAINFAALATGIDAAQRSFSQLQGTLADLGNAYAVQEMAEKRLETVMFQRMKATAADVQAIKDLASAQQALGVIGDEVQLSGAQQLATFLNQRASLETLVPAMNNLLAQQKGLNASTSDAVSIGNLMGKVMQGQVSSLKEVGITFDEAEQKVLTFGTEEEKAAMLAQVITNNVGEMNAALAATDSGKQQQLVNTLGDYKEVAGSMVNAALPFVTIAAQATTAASGVATLIAGVKTLSTTLYANMKAFAVSTAAIIKNKAATLAAAAGQKIAAAATAAWTAVQKVLNLVLTANPIGLVIAAVGALVTGLVAAYNSSEDFRAICDAVWEAIKPLAKAIMNGLAKAFEWLSKKCKEAWTWLKNILGLSGQKAEVDVEVTRTVKQENTPTIDLDAAKKKYADYKPGKATAPKLTAAPVASQKASEGIIGQLEEKISAARERLREATSAAAIEAINKEIEAYESELSKYEGLGKKVAEAVEAGVESNGPIWKADAATLGEIGDNIQILNDQLQNATVSEAAAINGQIDAWNAKADAIRNAGRAAEEEGISVREAMGNQWDAVKGVAGSIEGITNALNNNGNAWQKVMSIVDSAFNLYDGITRIIGFVNMLTGASKGYVTAKGAEAGVEVAATAARTAAGVKDAATSAGVIMTNKLEAASFQELAAAKYMAAHAAIPFAGFGIAAGFTTAMLAMVKTAGLPMLADGGIATGPTLAMVGEYAGASSNPEIIAPLDKLRGLLSDNGGGSFGDHVEFEIKGRTLVGILNKESNINRRT